MSYNEDAELRRNIEREENKNRKKWDGHVKNIL